MKKYAVSILLFATSAVLPSAAQTAADVSKNINKVKRDTMYIYAESTTKDLSEAYNNARALLEMQVGDWILKQHPAENIEVCIVKAKDHLMQLDTRRGDLYRAFVYVRKSDIMPVTDKSEVTVFEVAPVKVSDPPVAEHAFIVEESSSEEVKLPPVLELTPDELQMRQIRNFYDIEPFINGLKRKGKLKQHGKYATMPDSEDCYLFVYDKQGNIPAVLHKCGEKQYNLMTLNEDNVKNYNNCGAIWFQLKD